MRVWSVVRRRSELSRSLASGLTRFVRRDLDARLGGGHVLFILGFTTLIVWLFMLKGQRLHMFDVGQVRSLFLLVGLMCLFLGALKVRNAGQRRDAAQ